MKEFKGTKFPWNVQNELTIWGLYEGEKVCDVTETKDIHTSLRNDICRHNAKLISAAPELLEMLQETDKDLCALESTMLQIEKKDHLAEGMTQLVRDWRERNKKTINKALGL